MLTLNGSGLLQQAVANSATLSGDLPPSNISPPELAGKAEVGATVSARPGVWAGLPAPRVQTTLFVSGAPRRSPCLLGPEDDGKEIIITDTASNDAGEAVVSSLRGFVRRSVPHALGTPEDVSVGANDEAVVVDAGAFFVGTSGGQWSATCAAAADALQVDIDETGRVTLSGGTMTGSVVVSVSYSNSGGSASAKFTVSAVDTGSAAGPKYDGSLGDLSITGQEPVEIEAGLAFSGDDLAFSATGLPEGIAIDPETGRISGLTSRIGSQSVTVAATNSVGSISATFELNVVEQSRPLPDAPSYDGSLEAEQAITLGTSFDLAAGGAFAGDDLRFSANGLALGLDIDTATGRISGIPSNAGEFIIGITALNAGGTVSGTFLLMVTEPVVVIAPTYDGSLGTANAVVGAAFELSVRNAFGGDDLTFSATGLAPGLVLDATTGQISGAPSSAGSFSAIVTARNSSGEASGGFQIIIEKLGTITVDAPSYDGGMDTGLGPWPANKTVNYDTSRHASGADLTYVATGLPAGLSINTSTGEISGTPTVDGISSIAWTVTNLGGSVTISFNIVIGKAAAQSTASVASHDLVENTNSATLDIGTHDAARRVWATVMVGATQDAGFAVSGGPTATTNESFTGFSSRCVQLEEITGATGTTVDATWGGDTESVATFRTMGLRPKTGGAIVTGRQTSNNTTNTVLAVTVPIGGALLLHGKRYNGFSSSGPTITPDETIGSGYGAAVRGTWLNETGTTQSFNVTFTNSATANEKYGVAIIMEPEA